MKLLVLFFVLCGSLLISAKSVSKTATPKGQLASFFNSPASSKFRAAAIPIDDADDEHIIAELRQADAVEDEEAEEEEEPVKTSGNKPDASSGRLFKKFLLFKNMFGSGSSSQQPVIPIIITGAGSGTTGNTGTDGGVITTTITETGTLPTATGTITTSPINPRDNQYSPEEEEQEDAEAQQAQQQLQAALDAGQEYVVTDQEIKGTSESKQPVAVNNQQTSQINLKRKGAKRGQVITVRIPPKYRNFFKNGQRVVLNTSNNRRPVKRRVVKKQGNKIRRRKINANNINNLNKRRRVPVADFQI